jgi:hypothetical protein
LKNEVKKKMMIDSRKLRHQSHRRKNFLDECQPFFSRCRSSDLQLHIIDRTIPRICSMATERRRFAECEILSPGRSILVNLMALAAHL